MRFATLLLSAYAAAQETTEKAYGPEFRLPKFMPVIEYNTTAWEPILDEPLEHRRLQSFPGVDFTGYQNYPAFVFFINMSADMPEICFTCETLVANTENKERKVIKDVLEYQACTECWSIAINGAVARNEAVSVDPSSKSVDLIYEHRLFSFFWITKVLNKQSEFQSVLPGNCINCRE
jgi:hypothetical protein